MANADPAATVLEWSKSKRRIALGRLGEQAAVSWLERSGWQICSTNWRASKFGEIDIVALDCAETLVFIEVKTRVLKEPASGFRNEGFESITWRKKKKIISCAQSYMAKQKPANNQCRFDVIVVEYPLSRENSSAAIVSGTNPTHFLKTELSPIIRHIEGAFC